MTALNSDETSGSGQTESEYRVQTIREVVAYKRLKQWKIPGCFQKVVVYERFQLQGFDWEKFGVLDR